MCPKSLRKSLSQLFFSSFWTCCNSWTISNIIWSRTNGLKSLCPHRLCVNQGIGKKMEMNAPAVGKTETNPQVFIRFAMAGWSPHVCAFIIIPVRSFSPHSHKSWGGTHALQEQGDGSAVLSARREGAETLCKVCISSDVYGVIQLLPLAWHCCFFPRTK